MKLYPELTVCKEESKYGRQHFADGYVPIALDSEAQAVTRMLVALEAGKTKAEVIAAGLTLRQKTDEEPGIGSDEVATVERLYGQIIAERAALAAIPLCDEWVYTLAVEDAAQLLDPAKWVDAMREKCGGAIAAPEESDSPSDL
jgi:hypothetical protein